MSGKRQIVSGRRGKGGGYSQGEKDPAVIEEVRGGQTHIPTTGIICLLSRGKSGTKEEENIRRDNNSNEVVYYLKLSPKN